MNDNASKPLFDIGIWKKLAFEVGAEPYPISLDDWNPVINSENNVLLGDIIEDGKIVYIRDQISFNYKFHICHCKTIMDFLYRRYYNIRYRCIDISDVVLADSKKSNSKYKFYVNVVSEDGLVNEMVYREMQVCRNCLEAIDYIDEKGREYKTANERTKSSIVKNFNIDFFKEHYIINTPSHTVNYKW